jgi:hypothetical protein
MLKNLFDCETLLDYTSDALGPTLGRAFICGLDHHTNQLLGA